MNRNEILLLKTELLCAGIRITPNAVDPLRLKNRYIFEKGFIHAAHFTINETIINTCVSETFCEKSPYYINYDNGDFRLFRSDGEQDEFLLAIDVLELPQWCEGNIDGYTIGDYIRPHSENCIACWPYLICDYYSNANQCKFCSMGDYRIRTRLSENVVGKMIAKALSFNPNYELALSGGTCNKPDGSLSYFTTVCKKAVEAGAKYISVEITPPENLDRINELYEAGATAIIMNLEIADDTLRKIICPGKSLIPKQRYFNAFEHAVKLFGEGNVSSVLIAGLQPKRDIINVARDMTMIGVIPTIIPFKPLDGCLLNTMSPTSSNELLEIAESVEVLLKQNKLLASEQHGCTKCNGCSVEVLYENVTGGIS
jgi:hypothetical protein